ncbi:hypothetical protein M23134_00452 [Microscilla marina ATCC 23134]|uniref:Uncharacterized protein n=2 Tax=Microscilla marina TaxID=1027 RepID=A1ZJ32_MICM2|nr:hypothetical protein M23134_00452 [Microscilla marina ATCC 23134]
MKTLQTNIKKMKTNLFSKLSLALVLFFVGSMTVKAQTQLTHKSGLKITVPATWKHEVDGDDILTMVTPDENVAMTFVNIPASAFDAALAEAEKQIKSVVKNFKEKGEGKETKINGMDAFMGEGTGQVEGQDVEVGLLFVKNGNNVLFVFAIGVKGKTDAHDNAIGQVLNSIKK